MKYSLFTDMRTVTVRSPMIAIRNAHAFDPNSIVAKKRMPKSLVGAMTRTMSVSWHNSVHHRFSASSAS